MKICWITSYIPKQSGIAHYSHHAIEPLSKMNSVDVLKWNYDSFFSKLFSPVANVKRINLVLKEYDIVHVQYVLGEYQFLFLPILCLLSLRKKAKIVLTLHEDYANLRFSYVFIWFHNLFYHCADMLFVHTAQHKKLLSRSLQKRTEIIAFGVQPKRRSKGLKATILLPGFINPWKGHDTALLALAMLKKSQPKIKLIIAGKPYDKKFASSLKQLAADLAVTENVEWIEGFIPDDIYQKLFLKSEICILPYRRITMSAVLSDILGYAKPCVLSDLAQFREYTRGKALYCRIDDPADLADKLSYLLTKGSKRLEMASELSKLAKEYSWSSFAEHTLELYKSKVTH